MASGHLLLSCAKRAATTKIDLFAYLWQLPCALCSLILMTLLIEGAYHFPTGGAFSCRAAQALVKERVKYRTYKKFY